MNNIFKPTLNFIREDFRSHPFRFGIEVLAWSFSIACSIIFALSVPNPPFLILYPMWIAGCAMYAWTSWTRKSFGMLLNYVLLTSIDTIGLIRFLIVI